VRKNPSEDRGPKASIAIKQPQVTTTAGVRQPIDVGLSVVACTDIQEISGAAKHIGAGGAHPKRIFVILGICGTHDFGAAVLFARVLPK
jgi:hypothetical protein